MPNFRVVTNRNWLAEQFAPLGAVHDRGFDIDPATAKDTYWWAPGAWVASAHKAGVQLPLLSCGADWLPGLSDKYRGRRVQNKILSDIFPGKAQATFAKLPEVKLDAVPAQVYPADTYLRDTLSQYNLPAETVWQLQDPVDFMAEARYWVANGEVTTGSWYRIADTIWGGEHWDEDANTVHKDGLARMRKLAEEVARNVDAPPGYVLDIGMAPGGKYMVVEANAAWSSGPYDGDPAGIFEAIKAAHDFEGKYPQWAWKHSPVFDSAAALKVVAGVQS